MRRTDVILIGFTVVTIGAAIWIGFEPVREFQPVANVGAGVACLGALISLYGLLFMRDIKPLSADDIARKRAADRLREIADSTLALAQEAHGDDATFRIQFEHRWNFATRSALHNHLELVFGVGVHNNYLTEPIHLAHVDFFVSALRAAAADVERHAVPG